MVEVMYKNSQFFTINFILIAVIVFVFGVLCPLGLFCFVCIETIQVKKMSY